MLHVRPHHDPLVAQAHLDAAINNSYWRHNKKDEPFWVSFLPLETMHRWSSSRDAVSFANATVALMGSSPTRQLALHLPMLLNGNFDNYQCYPTHDFAPICSYNRSPCKQAGRYPAFHCLELPCNVTSGYGCHDCYCCCSCQNSRSCDGSDFEFTSSGRQLRGLNLSAPMTAATFLASTVVFSWKPELLNVEADQNALTTRFCSKPPAVLMIGKGVHEAYFYAHTLADASFRAEAWMKGNAFNGTNGTSVRALPRIHPDAHAERMESALRGYVPLLRCLPKSTLVLWLTPYVSHKAPGEQSLVAAVRNMMVRVHREGALERGVLLDTWQLTNIAHPPSSTDGHHRHSHFQTVVWTLVASVMREWRGLS